MAQFIYDVVTDKFVSEMSPDEFETSLLWLREAFKGISTRVHNGEAPIPAMEKLLRLEDMLREMNDARQTRVTLRGDE